MKIQTFPTADLCVLIMTETYLLDLFYDLHESKDDLKPEAYWFYCQILDHLLTPNPGDIF